MEEKRGPTYTGLKQSETTTNTKFVPFWEKRAWGKNSLGASPLRELVDRNLPKLFWEKLNYSICYGHKNNISDTTHQKKTYTSYHRPTGQEVDK